MCMGGGWDGGGGGGCGEGGVRGVVVWGGCGGRKLQKHIKPY